MKFILGLIFFASLSYATPLQDILDQYRKVSPSLRAQAAGVQAVHEQASAAGAYPAPELGFEYGSKAQAPGMSNAKMYYEGVTIGQEFMFPGKRAAMQNAESERFGMAQADYQAAERDGAFRVAQIYVELYMVQQRMRVLDSTIAVLSSLQESARRRFETGMTGMEDVFRLQSESARLRTDSLSLAGENRAMRIMLCANVGDATPLVISDSIRFRDEAQSLPGQDSLLNLAKQRPELASMVSGTRMAARELTAAKLRRMPDLMVQGRYMTMMGPDEWALMVGIKIPIAPWSNAESAGAKGTAQAREQEAKARVESMTLMLTQEVREAYERYSTAQSKLKQIEQDQVVAAENALRAGFTAYSNSKSDLSMTLDAVRMLLMAKEEAVMARVSLFQSILSLEKSSGVTPGTWLSETTLSQGSTL